MAGRVIDEQTRRRPRRGAPLRSRRRTPTSSNLALSARKRHRLRTVSSAAGRRSVTGGRLARMEHVRVAVVGAGQAGLATSHELTRGGGSSTWVLERGAVGQTWRGRWDSFCLVTPNWTVPAAGRCSTTATTPTATSPVTRSSGSSERYATSFSTPRSACGRRVDGLGCRATTASRLLGPLERRHRGTIRSSSRPVPTSGRTAPRRRPRDCRTCLTAGRRWLREPVSRCPPGAVPHPRLGSVRLPDRGGAQRGGTRLSTSRADGHRGSPRRLGDHDIVWWADRDRLHRWNLWKPTRLRPRGAAERHASATGRDGGHYAEPPHARARGVTLLGRFLGVARGSVARFAPDLGSEPGMGGRALPGGDGILVREPRGPPRWLAMPEILGSGAVRRTCPPRSFDLTGFGDRVFYRSASAPTTCHGSTAGRDEG